MIKCCESEIKELKRYKIHLHNIDFDLKLIELSQHDLHEKYEEKEKDLKVEIC